MNFSLFIVFPHSSTFFTSLFKQKQLLFLFLLKFCSIFSLFISNSLIQYNKVSFWVFFLLLASGYFLQTLFPPSQRSFQGCMQAILVDDQPADLHAVEKGTMGAFENVSLDMCAIIDR